METWRLNFFFPQSIYPSIPSVRQSKKDIGQNTGVPTYLCYILYYEMDFYIIIITLWLQYLKNGLQRTIRLYTFTLQNHYSIPFSLNFMFYYNHFICIMHPWILWLLLHGPISKVIDFISWMLIQWNNV